MQPHTWLPLGVPSPREIGHSVHVFREARLGDYDHIRRLYAQLNPDDAIPDTPSAKSMYEHILESPGLQLFVLELDGDVVGTTYLNTIPNLSRSLAPYALIENVVVEETLRGTGLGKQIMERTVQAAWSAGCYKAALMTGSRNPATHAFYRACGFSPDDKSAYVIRPLPARA